MPWKECNRMDERLRFVARLLDGEKMAVACREFGISRKTGYKIFDTRAAKATDKIAGKGYGLTADESLKTLPEPPPGATFNAEEQAKYRDFKEARRGAADYMAMEGEFARYLDDVYSEPPIEREALDDECEILVIGAGFAGLMLWHKLSNAGFDDVRFCEKGASTKWRSRFPNRASGCP